MLRTLATRCVPGKLRITLHNAFSETELRLHYVPFSGSPTPFRRRELISQDYTRTNGHTRCGGEYLDQMRFQSLFRTIERRIILSTHIYVRAGWYHEGNYLLQGLRNGIANTLSHELVSLAKIQYLHFLTIATQLRRYRALNG